MYKKGVLLALIIPCCWLVAGQFVVKKKKSTTPSAAVLREQCCTACGEQLKLYPRVLKQLAAVQESTVRLVYEYLEGSKVLASASKEQLLTYARKQNKFTELMQQMERALREHAEFLASVV